MFCVAQRPVDEVNAAPAAAHGLAAREPDGAEDPDDERCGAPEDREDVGGVADDVAHRRAIELA